MSVPATFRCSERPQSVGEDWLCAPASTIEVHNRYSEAYLRISIDSQRAVKTVSPGKWQPYCPCLNDPGQHRLVVDIVQPVGETGPFAPILDDDGAMGYFSEVFRLPGRKGFTFTYGPESEPLHRRPPRVAALLAALAEVSQERQHLSTMLAAAEEGRAEEKRRADLLATKLREVTGALASELEGRRLATTSELAGQYAAARAQGDWPPEVARGLEAILQGGQVGSDAATWMAKTIVGGVRKDTSSDVCERITRAGMGIGDLLFGVLVPESNLVRFASALMTGLFSVELDDINDAMVRAICG